MSDAGSDCRNAFGTALRLVAVAIVLFLGALVGCQPTGDESPPPPDSNSVSNPWGRDSYHSPSPKSRITCKIRSSGMLSSKNVRLSRTVA